MFIDIILVVSLQLFMGNSGLSSFGHIAFMLIGAYGSIWFTLTPREKSRTLPDMPESWPIYDAHFPFIPAIIAGALIATMFGALIGIALVRLRGASFTIATFALLVIVHSVAIQWEQVTRGARTVIGIEKYTGLWMAVVWALIVVVLALLFKETALGLKLRATREDEDAAASIGINAPLVRWIAWTVSVFFSALAGGLWAHFITTFSPNAFYLNRTFLIVAMLIIGGTGSVSGAVVGAVTVALTSEALRRTENWANIQRATETTIGNLIPFQLVGFTEIVLGIAIILVLILRPSGITGGHELRWPSALRPRTRGPRPQVAPEGARDVS
jgi:branched-chain amino acid transport system permease protein